jgi:ABC-type glycerol-3-phosphate transport system substrate-binding protein
MAESDAFLKSPGPTHKAVLLKMPSDARYLPFQPHWNEIQYGMIGPAMDRVWNGDEKPEPVLRELADKINRKYFSNN